MTSILLTPQELESLQEKENAVVIDTRNPEAQSYCQIWCMGIKPRSCLIDPVLARRP